MEPWAAIISPLIDLMALISPAASTALFLAYPGQALSQFSTRTHWLPAAFSAVPSYHVSWCCHADGHGWGQGSVTRTWPMPQAVPGSAFPQDFIHSPAELCTPGCSVSPRDSSEAAGAG